MMWGKSRLGMVRMPRQRGVAPAFSAGSEFKPRDDQGISKCSGFLNCIPQLFAFLQSRKFEVCKPSSRANKAFHDLQARRIPVFRCLLDTVWSMVSGSSLGDLRNGWLNILYVEKFYYWRCPGCDGDDLAKSPYSRDQIIPREGAV